MAATEFKANAKANMSDAKGLAGGYFFAAPLGSKKPTDESTALDEAFKCMGFIGEDGGTFESETDSEKLKDMNGDVVHVSVTSHDETVAMVLGEFKKGVLELMYGSGSVTDASGKMTVHQNGAEAPHVIGVFELVLKDGRKLRRLAHDMQVTELGSLSVKAGELFARECTFTAYKDEESGDYYTDYAASTETSVG